MILVVWLSQRTYRVAGRTVRLPLRMLCCLVLLGFAFNSRCDAEDFSLPGAWQDTKLYFTAPARWDEHNWLLFAGTVAAIAGAHQLDGKVRDHFAGKTPVLNGKDPNSTRDAAPAIALVGGTMALGWAFNNAAARNEAYRMLEAGALSAVTTTVVKYAAGRARPDETLKVDDWRTGGGSFPSLHVSAAFAIGTVLAESGPDDFRWTRRIVGYGVAAGTAYARLHGNAHWFSDVVAGSAIGLYTGAFTLQRQSNHRRDLSVDVGPTDMGGIAVQVTYRPH
jgi:membrane-associated phospholipid phosphatase